MKIQEYAKSIRISMPEWKLYVNAFPSWIPPEHTWPTEYGVPVSIIIIEKASEFKEGTVIIQFGPDEILHSVRSFLKMWNGGVWEVNTGASRSLQEMKIEARLEDVNKVEPDFVFTLKYPNECNYIDTPPSCRAVYYT